MNMPERSNSLQAVGLFLVWPFLSLASAFQNYKEAWAKNIFWAFCTFYGFSFAIGSESSSSDIVRYVAELQSLHGMPMTFSMAVDYFSKSGEVDVLRTLIAVVLSRFTDSQPILTGLYGFIFGYFFSRNIWFLLERLKGNLQFVTILLVLCFFLVNPIWNINGFRMWTATHIFLFGALPYLYEGRKYGIIIASSSILVHFSYILPLAVLIGYSLLGNRVTTYFIFFISTFFLSEINASTFNNIIEGYMPEIIQDRTSGYRSAEKIEAFRESSPTQNKNWYAVLYGKALSWSIMGFLTILFLKGREFIEEHKSWLRLFCFTLLYYGVANLMGSIPSGQRFLVVANLLALSLIILYVQNVPYERTMRYFVQVAIPALLLFIIVAVRVGFYSLSPTVLLGNPVIAFITMGENISMNDFMRMIL